MVLEKSSLQALLGMKKDGADESVYGNCGFRV